MSETIMPTEKTGGGTVELYNDTSDSNVGEITIPISNMSDYAAFIIITDQKYSSKFTDIIMNLPNVAQAIEHNFWSYYDGNTIAFVTRWITCTSTGISISKSTFTYWSMQTQPTNSGTEANRSADIRPRKIIGILK